MNAMLGTTGAIAATAALMLVGSSVSAQCQLQKLLASDGVAIDQFGTDVALGPHGLTVGAWRHSSSSGASSGEAYLFEPQGAAWSEVGRLVGSDTDGDDRFGMGIVTQGDTLVIGAFDADGGGATQGGAAYVFEWQGSAWVEVQKLAASDASTGAKFGRTLDLAADEQRLVVGAYHDASKRGAVYVFDRVGGVFGETQKLVASNGVALDNFGKRISIDGERIAVGANKASTGLTGPPQSGAAYVFDLIGSSWVETAQLAAGDRASGDDFGSRLDLVGSTLVVGGDQADLPAGADAGATWVFTKTPGGWLESAKIVASDARAGDRFGTAILLTADESTVLIGASFADAAGADSGAAYVFDRSGSAWTERVILTPSDAAPTRAFGHAFALYGDQLAISSRDDPELGGTLFGSILLGAGSAYLYSFAGLGCPTLTVDRYSVPLSTGASVGFALDAGASQGGRPYVLLGATSGHDPGVAFGGATIPLNYDGYTAFLLTNPGAPPLSGGVGVLDGSGSASASFSLPAGSDPALAGLAVDHAYVVYDLVGSPLVVHASNPAHTRLIP